MDEERQKCNEVGINIKHGRKFSDVRNKAV